MHNPLTPSGHRHAASDNGAESVSHAPSDSSDDAHLHAHVPVHYSSRTPARALLLGAVVAVALVALFIWGTLSRKHTAALQRAQMERDASAPVPIDVVHVQRAPSDKAWSLPGRANSFYETTIYARVNGYLSEWYKDIGAHVKKGDVLARIDTPELDDQFDAAQAKVNELAAGELVAHTSAEFAKASFGRYQASVKDGAVSQQEVDQKKAEQDASNARVVAATASRKSADAELKRLSTLKKFKEVVAPFDGVITDRRTDVGALVTAGSTTNTTPLFSIAQADRLRVYVDVPQPLVAGVKTGMTVAVEASEFPGRKFNGTVDATSLSIDVISKTLKVEVIVPNPDFALLPGMYVTATFQSTRAQPPLRVPPSALAFGPNGAQVAVVGEDGRVSFRPVTIGQDLGDSVEIAAGLVGNEVVALNVGSQVSEGEHVAPHRIDQPPSPASSPPGRGSAVAANLPIAAHQ